MMVWELIVGVATLTLGLTCMYQCPENGQFTFQGEGFCFEEEEEAAVCCLRGRSSGEEEEEGKC